jgi:cytochrome bd ubiquinol oxidase subunit II
MTLFWASALALSILLYVLLDGFDLGIGILSGFTKDDAVKRRMISAIAPVWDGNETWLVLTGTILFGAFPRIYAIVLSGLYLPICLMLGALILRGVAFEFRHRARYSRRLWDVAFAGGSLVAALVQGAALGALVEGLPLQDGHYAGGTFGWLTPFACLCGVGLSIGYTLLGASWLVAKSEGRLQEHAQAVLPRLTAAAMAFLAASTISALVLHIHLLDRWLDHPYFAAFPLIGAAAAIRLMLGARARHDVAPFLMTVTIFLSAFVTLALSFWPYMLPFSITVEEAAAPQASLRFMFWGAGLLVLPITVAYTAIVYGVFAGKIVDIEHDY